jgi:hypothetical protein
MLLASEDQEECLDFSTLSDIKCDGITLTGQWPHLRLIRIGVQSFPLF